MPIRQWSRPCQASAGIDAPSPGAACCANRSPRARHCWHWQACGCCGRSACSAERYLANQRLATRIAAQQQNLAPLLAQREQALAIAARNAALGALFEQVSAIEAAAEFEFLVGARYQQMLDWEFSPRALRVTLQDATPDNRAYVEALERSPWFDRVGVSPAPNPDQITLQIALTPRAVDTPLYVREARAGGDS
ncbi:MAG: hypothetical protein IPG20_10655 [Gammaproteobacteria bacterium]|nr:hypothetical protein [Gammaproteobacteria bacterium]